MKKKLDVGKDVWKHLPVKMEDLPEKFLFERDPVEVMRDYQDMLDAAGICRRCKDHKPCGCGEV